MINLITHLDNQRHVLFRVNNLLHRKKLLCVKYAVWKSEIPLLSFLPSLPSYHMELDVNRALSTARSWLPSRGSPRACRTWIRGWSRQYINNTRVSGAHFPALQAWTLMILSSEEVVMAHGTDYKNFGQGKLLENISKDKPIVSHCIRRGTDYITEF